MNTPGKNFLEKTDACFLHVFGVLKFGSLYVLNVERVIPEGSDKTFLKCAFPNSKNNCQPDKTLNQKEKESGNPQFFKPTFPTSLFHTSSFNRLF